MSDQHCTTCEQSRNAGYDPHSSARRLQLREGIKVQTEDITSGHDWSPSSLSDDFEVSVALASMNTDRAAMELYLLSLVEPLSVNASAVPVLARMLAVARRCSLPPADCYRRCCDSLAFERLVATTVQEAAAWPPEEEFLRVLAHTQHDKQGKRLRASELLASVSNLRQTGYGEGAGNNNADAERSKRMRASDLLASVSNFRQAGNADGSSHGIADAERSKSARAAELLASVSNLRPAGYGESEDAGNNDADAIPDWHGMMLRNALEFLPFGMLLLRGNGEVALGNAKGRTLLAGELQAQHPSEPERVRPRSRLAVALSENKRTALVLSVRSRDEASGATVNDERFITIEPLGSAAGGEARWHDRRAGFLILVKRNWDHALPSASLLQQFFGLSKAEARLGVRLMLGADVQSCADEFCISVATVRKQLRSLFAKTGTARQSELLGVLHSLPPGA
jgi:DNA-binding CsgD family transcriptional regulator